jgi:DNA-binding YbaB/EbfC family protein
MTDSPEQGFDFGALLEQAQLMQEQLMAAQAEAASSVYEGVAGGGAVRISVTGGMEFQSVTIRKDAVDPDDIDMLQDLVLAALHDATLKVSEAQQSSIGGMMPDLGGIFGGSGMPELGE